MLKTVDIECKLIQIESGLFQKICNEMMCKLGYTPYDYMGSQKGTYKTKLGTPDSVFLDSKKKYVYIEYTTQTDKLNKKIKDDVQKCLEKIENNINLKGKISKIIFMHNNKNPDETITEEIKTMCGDIEFEIYGIDFIANKLQNECKQIAISLLDLKDNEAQNILSLTDEQITNLATEISKRQLNDYKDSSLNEVKNKIENLYNDAVSIINNEDAVIYISDKNKNKLKTIYNSLEAFDFYYKDNTSNDAYIYYHNLLVILSRIDKEKALDKYRILPDFVKDDFKTEHFYTMILIDNNLLKDAEVILNELYYKKAYKPAFESLVLCYFLEENYDKVIEMLKNLKKEEFDRYGYLAAMFLISKNYKSKLSENDIMKLNNSKFKGMPLYYSCTAKMLYDLDKRKNKYKEQFKKGINLLNHSDVITINTMCMESIGLKLEEEMIKYLLSNKLTLLLKIRLINLLISKDKLKKVELEKIIELKDEIDETEFDSNYIDGKILEIKGKELAAISKYKESFLKKETISSAYKYINLSIKNKSSIDNEVLSKLSTRNDLNSTMLIVEAYKHIGNYEEAIKNSYKTLYLVNNNYSTTNVFKQFFGCILIYGNKIHREINYVCKDVVVVLSSKGLKKDKIVVLEDDEFYNESNKILNVEIIRTYSELGSELINHKVNETIELNNETYTIKDIKDKYTYFYNVCFKYVKTSKHIEFFTSTEENSEDAIEQIKNRMYEIDESVNKRLDIYQESKNIPLSALIDSEKSVDGYSKLINTLLGDKKRPLYAGETIDIDLSYGFVLDITSLIILVIFDKLNVFTEELCEKVYITTSLKNKFQYFYESLIRKQGEVESSLGVVNDNDNRKLSLSEIPVNDMIKLWKEVNKCINRFNVVDIESEKDEILNDTTIGFLDKTQFDLIELAKVKGLPFVCDDLLIRKLSNSYNIKHTNSLKLVEDHYSNNYKEFLNIIKQYAKCNYIYSLYEEKLSNLFKYLYKNYTEETKKEVEEVISSILENKTGFDYYVHIFINIISNLKNIQYVNIFDCVYENLAVTFIINTLKSNILSSCQKFGIDSKQYNL